VYKHNYTNKRFNIIRWNHTEDWFVSTFEIQKHIKSRERQVEIMMQNEDYSYMIGHVIDGRNLLPATCYLVLVWETIGMMMGKIYTSIPIVFRDIKFIRTTHFSKDGSVTLTIAIQKGTCKILFF
jgi:fatty acid synthase